MGAWVQKVLLELRSCLSSASPSLPGAWPLLCAHLRCGLAALPSPPLCTADREHLGFPFWSTLHSFGSIGLTPRAASASRFLLCAAGFTPNSDAVSIS